MTKIYIILYGILLLSLFKTSAQIPNRFLLFDVKSGLSQNSVTCFYENKKGLMWIGTQDGLNSFDGKTFRQFMSDPNDSNSLSNKYILKIQEDLHGNLWIGTAFGLNRLNPKTGKVDRIFVNAIKEKKQSISVYEQFLFDKDNQLLVLNQMKFYKIDIQTLQVTPLVNELASNLIENNNTGQHFIIRNDSLIHLRTNAFEINLKPKLVSKQIIKVAANQNFVLFYTKRTNPAIHIIDLKLHQWLDSLKLPSQAFDVKIRNDNTIDIALNNGFVSYQNLSKESTIYYDAKNPQSIPSGPIISTFTDSKNNLWIGSASSGIAIQPATFYNFNYIPSAHKNDAIQDISQQGNETIIASNTGVYRVEYGNMKLIKNFGSDRVNAALIKGDFIYVAVEQKGLFQLDKQGKILRYFTKTNSALQTNQIFDIKSIGEEIGICSEKYFYKLNYLNQISQIKVGNDSSKFTYVLSCNTDEQGTIYLATNNGVAILDQKGNTKQLIYANSDSAFLGKTIVSSVVPYKEKLIVSTLENGIFILKNNQILKHYNRNKGLENNVVYNAACTNNGDIWVCTNSGIARCVNGENIFKPISVYNGLPISYYSFGSMQFFNNSIFIGTDNGLFIGDVTKMHLSQISIEPYIEQISINGNVVPTVNNIVELDAYKRNTEITFGHATLFDNVILAYKLNSLPWVILPHNQKQINFSDFPLGDNSLEIKAANNIAGLDYAKVNKYAIHVKTPWYLRYWVIATAIFIFIYAVFYFVKRYFKRKNEQKILAFQNELNIQKERERISRDLHDNIGSYATALLSKIQQLKKENTSQDYNDMNELGNNIISNIRETIWIMQTKDIKLQDFSDKIKNYILKLKPIYPSVQMKVADEIENNISLSPTVTTHLFRIIQEAIHNCVKHAQASELSVSFVSANNLKITIKDNGIGYQTTQGEGHYGIKNMHERAIEIHFGFSISGLTSGTTIALTYPIVLPQ